MDREKEEDRRKERGVGVRESCPPSAALFELEVHQLRAQEGHLKYGYNPDFAYISGTENCLVRR